MVVVVFEVVDVVLVVIVVAVVHVVGYTWGCICLAIICHNRRLLQGYWLKYREVPCAGEEP